MNMQEEYMFSTYEHARGTHVLYILTCRRNTCSLHMNMQEEQMFSTYEHAGGTHVLYI
jgi:hypothetical protein